MSTSKISLKFYGRDFTKIKDTLDESINIFGETLNKDQQLLLILRFFESQKNMLPDLIVKTKNDSSFKGNDKEDIFHKYNDEYYWSGLVGIIRGTLSSIYFKNLFMHNNDIDKQYQDIEIIIQIQSRFDTFENNKISNLSNTKPYFLTTMLLQCKSGVNDQLVPSNSDDYFFDLLLLYLFKDKANKCYHKGLYKTYRRFEKNDDRLKGAIDVSRHIRLNMGMENGKIAYSYRENTIDNYLNHLILFAYNKLKKKYPDALMSVYYNPNNYNFKSLIDSLNSQINYGSIDSKTLLSKNLTIIAHPYYTEYEELRKISLKILRDEEVSMFNGNNDEVNGILFYIPDLWEIYLEYFLNDKEYHLSTQGYNNGPVRIIDYDDNSFRKKTFPDFVFSANFDNEDKPFMILDAKFKPDWGEKVSKGSSFSNDMLKDYDKCIRDMNSINAHASGVIFPTNINFNLFNDKLIHNISKFNSLDRFYTFPINVPYLSEDKYSKWLKDFNEDIKKVVSLIKEYIIKEKEFAIKYIDYFKKINLLKRD